MMCELTGMEVSNASLYDGHGTGRGHLMALHTTNKKKVIISKTIHPEYGPRSRPGWMTLISNNRAGF